MFEIFDNISLNSTTCWELLKAGVEVEAIMAFIKKFPL